MRNFEQLVNSSNPLWVNSLLLLAIINMTNNSSITMKVMIIKIIITIIVTQPNMNSVLKLATRFIEELRHPHVKNDGTQHTKARLREVLKEKWENKLMHGQYIRNIDRQLISEEDTFLWLSKGDLKAEI